ncbi:MAG: prepilin peptidase [Lentisphaeria bacterium]|nr:prepilin peptidase [Lentisphaeria bacterium]
MFSELNRAICEWLETSGTPGFAFSMIYAFVIGACFGSFATACIWRVPRGISIMKPRSKCPKCGHMITASENIPMLSWLLLKGKCSGCGLPISSKYFKTELVMAILFTVTAAIRFHYKVPIAVLPAWIMIWIAISSARTDLEKLIIPDMFTYTAMVLAILYAAAFPLYSAFPGGTWKSALTGTLLSGAATAIFGAAIVFSGKLLFGKDAYGWGDVKYMIATAMFFNVFGMMFILAEACIFSLIWFGLDRIKRGKFRRYFPFGPFLALATLVWCLLTIQVNGKIFWFCF